MAEKIKVFRYMGLGEKRFVEEGYKVFNTTDWHRLRGTASTAHGMSFGYGGKDEAIAASRYLKGIVDMYWLMTAEVDADVLETAEGRYPTKYDHQGNVLEEAYRRELCTEEYCLYDGNWENVNFYRCHGIDLRSRLVIVGNVMVTRREIATQAVANRIASRFRDKLAAGIDFGEYMNYNKGCRRMDE